MMLLLAAVAGVLGAGIYRLRHRGAPAAGRGPGRLVLPAALLAALIVVLLAELAPRRAGAEDGEPRFVVIAVDLSLSMDAVPDPRARADAGTRMARARRCLLEIVDRIEASGARAMVSVTGFTTRAQPIVVWDDDLAQVAEVVEHVLEPGLLTEPGSDPAAALGGAVALFDNLPRAYDAAGDRYLIVVSDGETTVERSDLSTGLAEVRARGIRVVALQVGAADVPEGLPLYDADGAFRGFREIGGRLHTVADPQTMALLAGGDAGAGRHVDAAAPEAAARIAAFMGVDGASAGADALLVASAVTLLGLSVTILLRFV